MVFTFSKSEKVGLVTVAIIISLLFLPLGNIYASLLSLTEAEPVLAQLSGQANVNINNDTTTNTTMPSSNHSTTIEDFVGGIINNGNLGNTSTAESFSDFEDDFIPFGEEQQPLTSSSKMDFKLFMESFTNSIFNATSIFGGVGTSMVNGIKVGGIGWDNNESQLSVTLSGKPMEVLGGNNTSGIKNDTTVTTTANSYNSVSVIAMRIPINIADILSLAAASSSQGMYSSSSVMTGDMDFNPESIFPSNPFSLLSSMQIGSTSLVNADWSVPQTVTMDLVGSNNNQEQQQSYSNKTTTADLLFVSVIPYTG
jgi:hypothetical protein